MRTRAMHQEGRYWGIGWRGEITTASLTYRESSESAYVSVPLQSTTVGMSERCRWLRIYLDAELLLRLLGSWMERKACLFDALFFAANFQDANR